MTKQEMHDYGYTWDGMRPLNKQEAIELFEYQDVYLLYPDDTEGMADSLSDIINFDGIFGVEIK